MSDAAFRLSERAKRTQSPPISYLMHMGVENPDVISLAAGLVDYASLPVEAVREAYGRLLSDAAAGRIALQYGTTAGLAELREAVLAHVESLSGRTRASLGLSTDHVVVTSGSQQMLFLLTDVLVDPGDIVITAAPSYFVYTGVLEGAGARVLAVPADAGGIRVDALARALEDCRRRGEADRVKILYVVSYFDNPAGVSIAADRRAKIVELARTYSRSHRILVIEDAAYCELQYEGDRLPFLKTYDPDNSTVALLMTFSKAFSAGMKTGYAFLPGPLVTPVLYQKGNHDFGSPNFLQHGLTELFRSGAYAKHAERVRGAYRAKRDVLLAALEEELGGLAGVHWTRPAGGLYVWMTLPEWVPTGRDSELFRRCLEAGVMYVPGEHCFAPDESGVVPQHHLRLSFGVAPPDAIREGVRRLASCVRDILEGRARGSARNPATASN
jgi:2-aminoadipate transaminase